MNTVWFNSTEHKKLQITHNIHRLSDISYLVSIVLDSEDALDMKYEFDRELIKNSHVEGFRKGKAPLHVVINKYGCDKYYKDMREYIAQKAFDEVTEKSDRAIRTAKRIHLN